MADPILVSMDLKSDKWKKSLDQWEKDNKKAFKATQKEVEEVEHAANILIVQEKKYFEEKKRIESEIAKINKNTKLSRDERERQTKKHYDNLTALQKKYEQTTLKNISALQKKQTEIMERAQKDREAMQERQAAKKRIYKGIEGGGASVAAMSQQLASGDTLGAVATGLASIPQPAAQAAGAAITAIQGVTNALGGMSEKYREVEERVGYIKTLLDPSESQYLDEIRSRAEQTSAATGVALTEILNGAYQAISAGAAQADNVSEYIDKVSKFAVATQANVETASLAVGKFLNSLGWEAERAGEAMDLLAKTQQKGVVSGQELAQYAPVAAKAMQNLGVSAQEYSAMLATMTQTVNIAETSTALNALARELKNVTVIEKLMKIETIEGFDAQKREITDTQKFYESLVRTYKENSNALTDAFGSDEAKRSLNALFADADKGLLSMLSAFDNVEGTADSMWLNVANTGKREMEKVARQSEIMEQKIGEAWSKVELGWQKMWLRLFDVSEVAVAQSMERLTAMAGQADQLQNILSEGLEVKTDFSIDNAKNFFDLVNNNMGLIKSQSPLVARDIDLILNNPMTTTAEKLDEVYAKLLDVQKISSASARQEAREGLESLLQTPLLASENEGSRYFMADIGTAFQDQEQRVETNTIIEETPAVIAALEEQNEALDKSSAEYLANEKRILNYEKTLREAQDVVKGTAEKILEFNETMGLDMPALEQEVLSSLDAGSNLFGQWKYNEETIEMILGHVRSITEEQQKQEILQKQIASEQAAYQLQIEKQVAASMAAGGGEREEVLTQIVELETEQAEKEIEKLKSKLHEIQETEFTGDILGTEKISKVLALTNQIAGKEKERIAKNQVISKILDEQTKKVEDQSTAESVDISKLNAKKKELESFAKSYEKNMAKITEKALDEQNDLYKNALEKRIDEVDDWHAVQYDRLLEAKETLEWTEEEFNNRMETLDQAAAQRRLTIQSQFHQQQLNQQKSLQQQIEDIQVQIQYGSSTQGAYTQEQLRYQRQIETLKEQGAEAKTIQLAEQLHETKMTKIRKDASEQQRKEQTQTKDDFVSNQSTMEQVETSRINNVMELENKRREQIESIYDFMMERQKSFNQNFMTEIDKSLNEIDIAYNEQIAKARSLGKTDLVSQLETQRDTEKSYQVRAEVSEGSEASLKAVQDTMKSLGLQTEYVNSMFLGFDGGIRKMIDPLNDYSNILAKINESRQRAIQNQMIALRQQGDDARESARQLREQIEEQKQQLSVLEEQRSELMNTGLAAREAQHFVEQYTNTYKELNEILERTDLLTEKSTEPLTERDEIAQMGDGVMRNMEQLFKDNEQFFQNNEQLFQEFLYLIEGDVKDYDAFMGEVAERLQSLGNDLSRQSETLEAAGSADALKNQISGLDAQIAPVRDRLSSLNDELSLIGGNFDAMGDTFAGLKGGLGGDIELPDLDLGQLQGTLTDYLNTVNDFVGGYDEFKTTLISTRDAIDQAVQETPEKIMQYREGIMSRQSVFAGVIETNFGDAADSTYQETLYVLDQFISEINRRLETEILDLETQSALQGYVKSLEEWKINVQAIADTAQGSLSRVSDTLDETFDKALIDRFNESAEAANHFYRSMAGLDELDFGRVNRQFSEQADAIVDDIAAMNSLIKKMEEVGDTGLLYDQLVEQQEYSQGLLEDINQQRVITLTEKATESTRDYIKEREKLFKTEKSELEKINDLYAVQVSEQERVISAIEEEMRGVQENTAAYEALEQALNEANQAKNELFATQAIEEYNVKFSEMPEKMGVGTNDLLSGFGSSGSVSFNLDTNDPETDIDGLIGNVLGNVNETIGENLQTLLDEELKLYKDAIQSIENSNLSMSEKNKKQEELAKAHNENMLSLAKDALEEQALVNQAHAEAKDSIITSVISFYEEFSDTLKDVIENGLGENVSEVTANIKNITDQISNFSFGLIENIRIISAENQEGIENIKAQSEKISGVAGTAIDTVFIAFEALFSFLEKRSEEAIAAVYEINGEYRTYADIYDETTNYLNAYKEITKDILDLNSQNVDSAKERLKIAQDEKNLLYDSAQASATVLWFKEGVEYDNTEQATTSIKNMDVNDLLEYRNWLLENGIDSEDERLTLVNNMIDAYEAVRDAEKGLNDEALTHLDNLEKLGLAESLYLQMKLEELKAQYEQTDESGNYLYNDAEREEILTQIADIESDIVDYNQSLSLLKAELAGYASDSVEYQSLELQYLNEQIAEQEAYRDGLDATKYDEKEYADLLVERNELLKEIADTQNDMQVSELEHLQTVGEYTNQDYQYYTDLLAVYNEQLEAMQQQNAEGATFVYTQEEIWAMQEKIFDTTQSQMEAYNQYKLDELDHLLAIGEITEEDYNERRVEALEEQLNLIPDAIEYEQLRWEIEEEIYSILHDQTEELLDQSDIQDSALDALIKKRQEYIKTAQATGQMSSSEVQAQLAEMEEDIVNRMRELGVDEETIANAVAAMREQRSYASGGWIDEDQVAQIHAGEFILPASSAKAIETAEPGLLEEWQQGNFPSLVPETISDVNSQFDQLESMQNQNYYNMVINQENSVTVNITTEKTKNVTKDFVAAMEKEFPALLEKTMKDKFWKIDR